MEKSYTIGNKTFILDQTKAEEAFAAKKVINGRDTMCFNILPPRFPKGQRSMPVGQSADRHRLSDFEDQTLPVNTGSGSTTGAGAGSSCCAQAERPMATMRKAAIFAVIDIYQSFQGAVFLFAADANATRETECPVFRD